VAPARSRRPEPWSGVSGSEVVRDDHLTHVANRIAPLPDDPGDDGQDALYTHGEIGDTEFGRCK
jgi:hypothetical protein